MNTRNIEKLADHLESLPPTQFDMETFGRHEHECGTVACIAGHTILLLKPDDVTFEIGTTGYTLKWSGHHGDVEDVAANILGLTNNQASELFIPINPNAHCGAEPGEPDYIDLPRAIAQLRHLAKNGTVNWEATPNG